MCPESPVMTCPKDPRQVPSRSAPLTDADASGCAKAEPAWAPCPAQPAVSTIAATASPMKDVDCLMRVPPSSPTTSPGLPVNDGLISGDVRGSGPDSLHVGAWNRHDRAARLNCDEVCCHHFVDGKSGRCPMSVGEFSAPVAPPRRPEVR